MLKYVKVSRDINVGVITPGRGSRVCEGVVRRGGVEENPPCCSV